MQNRLLLEKIEKGKFNDAVKIWEQYHNSKTPIDIHYNDEIFFRASCKNGQIYSAKWLFALSNIIESPININIKNNEAFRYSCQNGFLNIAKWLIEISTNIDIHSCDEEAFVNSCRNGYFEVVKWLWNYSLNIKSPINIHAENEAAFRWVCYNDNYDILKWLLNISEETNSQIDIHIENESAFTYSCYMGNFRIVKFLLEYSKIIKSPINIRINNDYPLQLSCKNEHLNIAKLLCSYCDNYSICLQKNKKIKYKILSDDEILIKAISSYNKIYINKNDINYLKKMFCEYKKNEDEICTVCFDRKEKLLLNFKCKINDNVYDHCYCTECFAKWYIIKQREKKCMCCYTNINLKNCVLIIP